MSKSERNIIKFEDILARDEKSNVLFFNYDNEAFMNTGIQEIINFMCLSGKIGRYSPIRKYYYWTRGGEVSR